MTDPQTGQAPPPSEKGPRMDRRTFLTHTALAGVGLWSATGPRRALGRSANERLNLGIIGTGSRGQANIEGILSENVVAICDVDERHLGTAAEAFPKAARFADWRKLLDRTDLDAVVVSTTDHTHAPIALAAMRAGRHVYCEKPIGISVEEARLLRQVSLETGVATQQGTQVHATESFRSVAQAIQDGVIGPVREVHVWCTRDGGGWARPTGDHPVPPYLNWDLWLGPAPERPYNPAYLPGCALWNKYWDFGAGVLGDMGSHLIDYPYAALNLTLPTSVEAQGEPVNDETTPAWMTVRWDHPARGDRPALKVYWYDGIRRPDLPKPINTDDWHGIVYVGDGGRMLWANYGGYAILPAEDPEHFVAPVPNVPAPAEMQGQYDEWIAACKNGSPTACNFDYAGQLIEHNMLGIVAIRTGETISWDAANRKAVGCPEADRYIHRTYREGWALDRRNG